MRLKKKSLVCALIPLLALSLCACHGNKRMEEFAIPKDYDDSKEVSITFWAKNDSNKNQTAIYNKAIEDFEKMYPNIKVNIKLYSDYVKLYNDVITNISTSTTPNVCITYPDHIATYISGDNAVVPLDDLMADERYGLGGSALKFEGPAYDEMVTEFVDGCRIDGTAYAMPYMRSTEACYINKTYVEALGYEVPDILTWDYIWEVSEAATAKDDNDNYLINGQKVMIPFIYKSTDNMMIQSLKQLDADYSDDQGHVYLFNDDTKQILTDVAEHVSTGAFSTFKISSYPANFLNAGQCIFAIDSTAGSTWMGADAPLSDIDPSKKVEFETVVRPIPQYDVNNPKIISQGPSVCIFNKSDRDKVMASWLFVQYLLSNDVQIAYSKTEGYIPVTYKALNSEEYKDYLSNRGQDNNEHYAVKIDAVNILLNNISNTFTAPVFNGSASLREASGQLIEEVAKRVRRGGKIDDEYIEQLYDEITALYKLDQIYTEDSDAVMESAPLPGESVALIAVLLVTWILIIAYFIYSRIKKNS